MRTMGDIVHTALMIALVVLFCGLLCLGLIYSAVVNGVQELKKGVQRNVQRLHLRCRGARLR